MKKIFYGVQGTGNGHITRARVMAKALAQSGFDVDFLFTGRPADKYFDMAVFGDYLLKDGLTFNTDKGQVNYFKTMLEAKPLTFVKDVSRLDLRAYDLVITDFEPVTAWSAKQQGIKTIGIGHQYAFDYAIPRKGRDVMADAVMKNFAPVSVGIGLHWHHFGQPILPPVIDTPEFPTDVQANKIVVYLPFEEPQAVIKHLCPFENHEFHVYSPNVVESKYPHIITKPLSRDEFQADARSAVGVISNSGFELASESLQMGKKILAKPLHRQMEQLANAAALEQLGYGQIMMDIDAAVIEDWLHNPHAIHVTYPNVAEIIVKWIEDGMPAMDQEFIEKVWSSVDVLKITR